MSRWLTRFPDWDLEVVDDFSPTGQTVLQACCQFQYVATATQYVFLDARADPHTRGTSCFSSMFLACGMNDNEVPEFVGRLLTLRVNVREKVRMRGTSSASVYLTRVSALGLLLHQCGLLRPLRRVDPFMVDIASEYPSMTALHGVVAWQASVRSVESLLEAAADLTARTQVGTTPIELAVRELGECPAPMCGLFERFQEGSKA